MQSLPPEKGGAPAQPYVIKVGEQIELFRFWEISVSNEGKIKAGNLGLHFFKRFRTGDDYEPDKGSFSDLQLKIGLRNLHFLEEHLGHVVVVVLTRVNDELAPTGPRTKPARDHRRLHKLRSSSYDGYQLH